MFKMMKMNPPIVSFINWGEVFYRNLKVKGDNLKIARQAW